MKRFLLLSFLSLTLLSSLSCRQIKRAKTPSLEEVVNHYHKNLLFARFDAAAASVAEVSREEWIMRYRKELKDIRYAEIEIIGIEYIKSPEKLCAKVSSRYMWYFDSNPSTTTAVLEEYWCEDTKAFMWEIVSQTESR